VPFLGTFPSFVNPIGSNTNNAISRINTGAATGNVAMSGGATFTVPVLDTQEFYQGILTPVPLQVVDYYLQQGFPPELLFDLFVNKIEVIRLDDGNCEKFTFQNSVRNPLQFGQFQAFIDYMIGSGLSAERINSISAFGPPIPQASNVSASVSETAQILDAYSKVSAAGLDIRQEGTGANARYRVQKRSNVFRFCFAHPSGLPSDWIGQPNSSMFCGQFNRVQQARAAAASQAEGGGECTPRRLIPRRPKAPESTEKEGEGEEGERSERRRENMDSRSQGVSEGGVSEFRGIRLAPPFLRRIDLFQREILEKRPNTPSELMFPVGKFANGLVSFKVYTRSTEGILYYLGEVIRQRLFSEFGDPPRVTQVKTSIRHGTLPLSECDDRENGGSWQSKTDLVYLSRLRAGSSGAPGSYYCENLFVLDAEDVPGDAVITVSYDGKSFSIPRDSNRGGRTLQVLELVKQLLALNTSARQLPSTSVLSVVGGSAQ
jgi:hypothetical protein